MSRLIRIDEDLSGRTLDVSTLPEGHARESYIGRGSLQGATIIGDIRGSDILGVPCEGIDLSQAETYGCLWTGSTFDATSVLPADPGPFQREITYELVRRRISQLPQRWRQRARDILIALSAGDNTGFCALAADVWQRDPDMVREFWQALPVRVRRFVRKVFLVADCTDPPTSTTAMWPDGIQILIDRDNLPPLPRPDDRYELKQWLIAQAGPFSPEWGFGRHCWVASIRPWPRVRFLSYADQWFMEPYSEF